MAKGDNMTMINNKTKKHSLNDLHFTLTHNNISDEEFISVKKKMKEQDELEDEKIWNNLFDNSQDFLSEMVAKVKIEIKNGNTFSFDPATKPE